MIGDTIGITYNAVAKTLKKVNQDNYAADYYLEDGQIRFRLRIAHTIPSTGKAGESHIMRLDVEHYDVAGLHVRTCSHWTVMRTDVGLQDFVSSQRAQAALLTATTVGNTDKVLGRES